MVALDVYDTRSLSSVCMTYEQFGGDGPIPRDAGSISAPTPDDVIGFDALWDAMELCKSGVLWKRSVASFWMNGAEHIARMSRELRDGTYRCEAWYAHHTLCVRAQPDTETTYAVCQLSRMIL